MDDPRRGFDESEKHYSYDTLMRLLKTVDILVLDDLGTENPTDFAGTKLNQIIDYRYYYEMPTVFTGNIGKEGLAPRIASRISEGVMVLLECGDYRKKIAVARVKE